MRGGLEGGRHMERRNRDGWRNRKRGRDGDGGGGVKELFPSCRDAGF